VDLFRYFAEMVPMRAQSKGPITSAVLMTTARCRKGQLHAPAEPAGFSGALTPEHRAMNTRIYEGANQACGDSARRP